MFASRIVTNQDTSVWSCSGALDGYTASRAREDLAALGRCGKLIVDLTDCVFVDSGGLRIVEEAAAACGATQVVVRTSDPRIWDLLRIAGLDRVFEVETVEATEGLTRIRRIRTAQMGHKGSYRRSEPARIRHSPRAAV